MKTETGVRQPRSIEYLEPPEAGRDLSGSLQRECGPTMSEFQTVGLQNATEYISVVLSQPRL